MKNYTVIFATLSIMVLSGASSQVFGQWYKHNIDPNISYPAVVTTADIDGDGDLDVAATGYEGNNVNWYENDNLSWEEHEIDNQVLGPIGIEFGDLDGDEDMDAVVAGLNSNEVVWYENKGGTPIIWEKHTIDDFLTKANEVRIEDIDGDGDLDFFLTVFAANDVLWYKNEGGTPIDWTKYTIDSGLDGAHGLFVTDINKDGNPDLAVTALDDNEIVWYKNILPDNEWGKIKIDSTLSEAFDIHGADIDGDGDMDLAATGQNATGSRADVRWYENVDGIGDEWTSHEVSSDLYGARCLWVEDFDLNGRMDIVVTERHGGRVILFQSADFGETWLEFFIDNNLGGANDIISADLDADGQRDLVATAMVDDKVVWYQNKPERAIVKTITCWHPDFIPKDGASLVVNATLHNPEDHAVKVQAIIEGDQLVTVDSLTLYDDGNHNDSLASDNIWGNSKWLSDLPEDLYSIHVTSYDEVEEFSWSVAPVPSFTTIGPLVVDSITDGESAGGLDENKVSFELVLKNLGEITTAEDIRARIFPDTTHPCFLEEGKSSVPFDDMGPDQTAQGQYTLYIALDCSEDLVNIPLDIEIESHGKVYWTDHSELVIDIKALGVEEVSGNLPSKFSLEQNYPNPFNPRTIINYELPITNDVDLSIYNLTGQKVATLVNESQRAGRHQVEWDASGFASGVYYCRIEAGEFVEVKKMVLLR
jgi:hypothetical protein